MVMLFFVCILRRLELFVKLGGSICHHFMKDQSINQSINQHHGLSPMQEVAAIYNKKELMSTISS